MSAPLHPLLPRRAGEKVPQADEGVPSPGAAAPPSPRKRGEGKCPTELR